MSDCKEMRALIPLYLDGELPPRDVAAFEAHSAACPECRARLAAESALSRAIREKAPRPQAPAALARSIRAAIRAEAKPAFSFEWKLPAAFLSGALASGFAALLLVPRPTSDLGPQLLASHLRSLQPGHLTDVVSTNNHTVKPWFNGRIDFSPRVVDLASDGFPLAGGRLDAIDGQSVAVLVYHRRAHVINVYVRPSSGASGASSFELGQGFHELGWARDGLDYRAVSDVNETEMRAFVELQKR